MKKLLLIFVLIAFQKSLLAQCDIAQKLLSVSPASIAIGEKAEIAFEISNAGNGAACSYPAGSVEIVLSLPSTGYNFDKITSPVAGLGTYFNWEYDSVEKVVIGTNHTALPQGAIENVSISVLGVSAKKASSNLNIGILDGSSNKLTSNDIGLIQLTVGTAAPLPVRLISFDGKPTSLGNELNWTVSSEQNFSHYEVEKSTTSKYFNFIGKVDGSKNTKEKLTYTFLDKNGAGMLPGANTLASSKDGYYRLKIVDLDGKFEYSKIVFIKNEIGKSTVGEFYPNPSASNDVNIKINSSENTNWVITSYDLSGRVLNIENRELEIGENQLKISIKNSVGLSIVRFENGEAIHFRKVNKQ